MPPGGRHGHQVDNIMRVVDRLKRHDNVDESRIYLTGISDGGTGAYYLAMREPTPWLSVLPLNGSLAVLRSPSTRVEGELYGNNLVNKPLYVVKRRAGSALWPDTRLFGLPTCGLSTANSPYTLSDGAILNLTTAVMADRTQTRYGDQVQPDEAIADRTELVNRAIAWLQTGR